MGIKWTNETMKEIFDKVNGGVTVTIRLKDARTSTDEVGTHKVNHEYTFYKSDSTYYAYWTRIDEVKTVFGSDYTDRAENRFYHGDAPGFVKFLLRFNIEEDTEYEFV